MADRVSSTDPATHPGKDRAPAASDLETLGLIAGDGRFPGEVAEAMGRRGRRVHAVGFRDLTDPALERQVGELHWLHLGELDSLIGGFRAAGVRDAVMAGKVSKDFLFERREELRPDDRALALLGRLSDRSDDSILGLLADELEAEGIRLLPQAEAVPELVVAAGVLGRVAPSAEQRADLAFGWSIAKTLGGVDVGQTVVVKHRAVLAVEAMEGTDATILRGGALGGPGATVVKVAKPLQDPRFDLPAIGPRTLACMLEVGAGMLACEAGYTLAIDRDRMVSEADVHGIAILGVGPEDPAPSPRALGGSPAPGPDGEA